ncbi:MAG: hypothetical protein LBE46_05270 [Wolbachia pipientis]|nr:hypothetical protein [Wolbachia pipientis]
MLRHWDPEKLIVHYTTFSIKSWMPVSSTGMIPFAVWITLTKINVRTVV